MIEIEKPRIERVEASDSYGKFVVEPLEHGFGQTLGNSLRRVLLSSLPGVAVSSIRIEGIQHEFSAVPGVKEDVAEIILNLKELSAKLYCDGPKTVSINVKGPCELTAAALAVDDQIEVVNRDLHIATLDRRDFGVYRTERGTFLRNVLDAPAIPRKPPRAIGGR